MSVQDSIDNAIDSLIDEVTAENIDAIKKPEMVAYEKYIERYGYAPKIPSHLVAFAKREGIDGVTYAKSKITMSLMKREETVRSIRQISFAFPKSSETDERLNNKVSNGIKKEEKNSNKDDEKMIEMKLDALSDTDFDAMLNDISNEDDNEKDDDRDADNNKNKHKHNKQPQQKNHVKEMIAVSSPTPKTAVTEPSSSINVKKNEEITCPANHVLKNMDTGYANGFFKCHQCNRVFKASTSFRCDECSFDLCGACYFGKKKDVGSNNDTSKASNASSTSTASKTTETTKAVQKKTATTNTHGSFGATLTQAQTASSKTDNKVQAQNTQSVVTMLNGLQSILNGMMNNMVLNQENNVFNWQMMHHKQSGNFGAMHQLMQQQQQQKNESNKVVKKSNIKCINNLHTLCKSSNGINNVSNDENKDQFKCSACKKTVNSNQSWHCDLTSISNVSILNLDGNEGKNQKKQCNYNLCDLCFNTLEVNTQSAIQLKKCIEFNENEAFNRTFETLFKLKQLMNMNFYTKQWENGDLIATAVSRNNVEITKLLLENGANPNNSSNKWKIKGNIHKKGETLLHEAARQSNTEICQLLLQHGGDPNILSKDDISIFMLATQSINYDMLKLLIKHGFDYKNLISVTNKRFKMNCLHFAATQPTFDCFKYICQISNIDKLDSNYDKNALGLIDMYANDNENENLLYKACICRSRNPQDAELIVNYVFNNLGFDESKINEAAKNGETAVHVASDQGLTNVLKIFYAKGGNINNETIKGMTPLMLAVAFNRQNCVEWLVNNEDCNVNYMNKKDLTALSFSIMNKNVECTKILAKCSRLSILQPQKSNPNENALRLALLVSTKEIVQILCHELIKKENIQTFEQFKNLQLFGKDDKDINLRLQVSKNVKNYSVSQLLIQLFENGYNNKNFDYIKVLFDYEHDSMAQKQIENDYFDMLQTTKIVHLLLSKADNGNGNCKSMINDTFEVILKLIENNDIINDLLLFIANKIDQRKLMRVLEIAISKALAKGDNHDLYKYCWYKQCLLFSKLWSLKKDNKNNTNNRLLFDEMNENVIEKELQEQKKYIKSEIENEMKTEAEAWNSIIKFTSIDTKVTQLQHLDPSLATSRTVPIIPMRYLESEFSNDIATNFNASQECDFGYYLTKLLIISHKINDEFQNECQRLLCKKSLFVDCKFTRGNVKKRARCQTKAMIDYWIDPWPKTASIVDLMRCSVIFNNCKDMLIGLNNFKGIITRNQSQYIKHILRIKNMFRDNNVNVVNNGSSSTNGNSNSYSYSYSDIKLNVLFEYENIKMVCEIQFLLDWMVKAKKLGHSLYGFSRNIDYSKELSTMYYTTNDNDSKLKRLSHIITTNNFQRLQNILLYQSEIEVLKMKYIKFDDSKTIWQHFKQNNFRKGYQALAETITKYENDKDKQDGIPQWDEISFDNNNMNGDVKTDKEMNDETINVDATDGNFRPRTQTYEMNFPQQDDQMSSLLSALLTFRHIEQFYKSIDFLKNTRNKTDDEICKIVNLHENGLAFFRAVRTNNIDLVKLFLKKFDGKSNINYTTKDGGYTPLLISAKENNYEMCQLLLENGANVNAIGLNGSNVIVHACINGNVRLLQLLTQKEYRCDFAKLINLRFSGIKATAFFVACETGNMDTFKYLLQLEKQYNCSIDVNVELSNTCNVLIAAINHGNSNIVDYLLSNPKYAFSNPKFLNKKIYLGRCATWFAAAYGQVGILKLLVKYGADINIRDNFNHTPLYAACANNQSNCVNYLVNECKEMECNVNVQSASTGTSALGVACILGHFECVKILCQCARVKILNLRTPDTDISIVELTILSSIGGIKVVQYLYQILMKRYNIIDFNGLIEHKIVSIESMNELLEGLASANLKIGAMYKFLTKLLHQAIIPQNFEKFVVLIDFENNDGVKKQQIDIDYAEMNKNYLVARKFVEYISQTKNGKNTLTNWNSIINTLIHEKEAINDCLLFIGNIINQEKLINSLKTCISDCIGKERKNERDYAYFKQCLLHSSIWSLKVENMNSKDRLLFDVINNSVINPLLLEQQRFIKKCVLNEINNDKIYWKELCNFKEYNIGRLGIIRQDETIDFQTDKDIMIIENKENKFDFSQLFSLMSKLSANGVSSSSTAQEEGLKKKPCEYTMREIVNDRQENWNGCDEYNFNGYLIQLLLIANNVNYQFQSDCKKFFTDKKRCLVSCTFKKGTIKTKERSVKKTITDYLNRKWPQCACILDFVRCSVSFDTAQDLIKCLQNFKSNVDLFGLAERKDLGCLTRIVRIKNTFKNFAKLNDGNNNNDDDNMSQYTYADIKVNVLIEYRGTKMIGEIQFILNWMLNAKKLGHTLYGFSRNEEYMQQLSNLFYNNTYMFDDGDKKDDQDDKDDLNRQFANEMRAMVINKNFEKLEKMLLFASKNKIQQLNKYQLKEQLTHHKWDKGLKLYQSAISSCQKSSEK